MQGRLSPISHRGLQAFPESDWEGELPLIRNLGLSRLEWLVDRWNPMENPILSSPGWVQERLLAHGIEAPSLCFDSLLAGTWATASLEQLLSLAARIFQAAPRIGTKTVCVPFLEHMDLDKAPDSTTACDFLDSLLALAERFELSIALEASLPPNRLRKLIDQYQDRPLKIALDIGNLVEVDGNVATFIDAVGKSIAIVHFKDRNADNAPVPIGDGIAQISTTLTAMREGLDPKITTLECYRSAHPYGDVSAQIATLRAMYDGTFLQPVRES